MHVRGRARRRRPISIVLGAALALLPMPWAGGPGASLAAQTVTVVPSLGETPPLPAGEELKYGLSLGPIHAGHATLAVRDTESLDGGAQAYRVTLKISGGALFLVLDDSLVSWIAVRPLRTLRSDRRLHEGPLRLAYRLDLSRSDGRYHTVPLPGAVAADAPDDQALTGPMPVVPLDELAVLFLPLSLPLDPGVEYLIPQYFRAADNPISIHVLERTKIRTPAGTFPVLHLAVEIPGSDLFAPERHSEVYVRDDPSRTLIQLTSSTLLGTLRLYLISDGS